MLINTLPEKKNAANEPTLGRSRGGWTTKIHAIVDRLGRPLTFMLTGGQGADINCAAELFYRMIAQVTMKQGAQNALPSAVIGDRAYDADSFVEILTDAQTSVVIPPRKNRRRQRDYDKELYRNRNQVERFFNRLKHSRRIATRYEKTTRNFLAFILIASLFEYL